MEGKTKRNSLLKNNKPTMSDNKQFEWTDELVKEFCNWFTRIPANEVYKKDRFEEFKQLKSIPNKQDGRIPPILGVTIKGNVVDYNESASFQMGEDGKPEIISMAGKVYYPTESCLNSKEDNEELVGLLRDCVSSTWGNPSLTQTQVLFDNFLHKRKLTKPSKELINSFITDAINRNIYDKKYSQSEVDTIREETWNAARENKLFNEYQEFSDKTYPTLQDYLNSLSKETKQKEEDKPVERPLFEEAIREVINRYSMENGSNTPDFILAEYLSKCLDAFNRAVGLRSGWYNQK